MGAAWCVPIIRTPPTRAVNIKTGEDEDFDLDIIDCRYNLLIGVNPTKLRFVIGEKPFALTAVTICNVTSILSFFQHFHLYSLPAITLFQWSQCRCWPSALTLMVRTDK